MHSCIAPPLLCRHFPSDVLTGLAIGFLTSFFVYRLLYPVLTHPACDVPTYLLPDRRAPQGSNQQQQQQQEHNVAANGSSFV